VSWGQSLSFPVNVLVFLNLFNNHPGCYFNTVYLPTHLYIFKQTDMDWGFWGFWTKVSLRLSQRSWTSSGQRRAWLNACQQTLDCGASKGTFILFLCWADLHPEKEPVSTDIL
jgi:hypothetical protein